MNTSSTKPSIKRWFAWGVGVSLFFPTYEQAWAYSEKARRQTGRIITVEPVYSL